MATYKRLTLAQRYLIQSLHQRGKTQHCMAQQICLRQATISRELAKQRHQQPKQAYDAQQAQQRTGEANKRTPYKLRGLLLTTVIARLRDRLSPEQICGELQRVASAKRLHHETIYRYIYRDAKQLPITSEFDRYFNTTLI